MRRTRHVVLPVKSWQYMGLMLVSLACLTLGLVSRDRGGRSESLAGPELQHSAPHEVDACPNSYPLFIRKSLDVDSEQRKGQVEFGNTQALISVGTLVENRGTRDRRSIARDRRIATSERREDIGTQKRIRERRMEERSERTSGKFLRNIRSRRSNEGQANPSLRSGLERGSSERRVEIDRKDRNVREYARSGSERENREILEKRSSRLSNSRMERAISEKRIIIINERDELRTNERRRRTDYLARRSSSFDFRRARFDVPHRRVQARSLERGSIVDGSVERQNEFSTDSRTKQREISPERRERRSIIFSRSSGLDRSSRVVTMGPRSLIERRMNVYSDNRRSRERDVTSDNPAGRSVRSESLRNDERREVLSFDERSRTRRFLEQADRSVRAERKTKFSVRPRQERLMETSDGPARAFLQRGEEFNRRERRLNNRLGSRSEEHRFSSRLDRQRAWIDSLRRGLPSLRNTENRQQSRSISADSRRAQEVQGRTLRISRGNERRASTEGRLLRDRRLEPFVERKVHRSFIISREPVARKYEYVREEERSDRLREMNGPHFVKNIKPSDSNNNEYLRQATILILCALYGASLLKGKSGFYSFRDIVNPIGRSIVG